MITNKTRNILGEQSSVGVTLNGGKLVLDDATIPFQIAFDEKIGEKKPTHILVIDLMSDPFYENGGRIDYCQTGKRQLFDLKPVNYLQFKKSGVHKLIFVLIHLESKDREYLLKSDHGKYANGIWFSMLENGSFLEARMVGYVEKTVEVPREFFAKKPKSVVGKALWAWTNRWYESETGDQCMIRRRRFFAFGIQWMVWLLGLVIRTVFVFIMFGYILIKDFFLVLFGYQPMRFIPHSKLLFWDFWFCFRASTGNGEEVLNFKQTWGADKEHEHKSERYDSDFYPYKTIVIGKNRFHSPLTLFGYMAWPLAIFVFCWMESLYFSGKYSWGSIVGIFCVMLLFSFFFAIISMGTIKTMRNGNWKMVSELKELSNKYSFRIFLTMALVSIGTFLIWVIVHINWLAIWRFFTEVRPIVSVKPTSGFVYFLVYAVTFIVFTYVLGKSGVLSALGKWCDKALAKLSGVMSIRLSKSTKREAKFFVTTKIVQQNQTPKINKREQWMKESFDLQKLPEKVDIKTAPQAYTAIQKFSVSFNALKAKVCKPYEDD